MFTSNTAGDTWRIPTAAEARACLARIARTVNDTTPQATVVDLSEATSISRAQLTRIADAMGLSAATVMAVRIAPGDILVQRWNPATRSAEYQRVEVRG